MITKNQVVTPLIHTKNHIIRNRGKYAFVAGIAAVYKLHLVSVKQWNEFLVEKGIDPTEFFCPELFEEMQAK